MNAVFVDASTALPGGFSSKDVARHGPEASRALSSATANHGEDEAPLAPGTYVTAGPFIDNQSRTRLSAGRYRFRVRLILGDSEHAQSFYSYWKCIAVARN